MIFVYKKWDKFCRQLHEKGLYSIPAKDVNGELKKYLVLKHDVETDVIKAYQLAKIEHKYGHKGVYYVQAYLLDSIKNIEILKKMKDMGHEISYHYDVMDSCRGNLEQAIVEFKKNKEKFEKNGFILETLCQHGNPIVNRVGYTSNRDFFRSEQVRNLYPNLNDIMVNFKEMKNTEYVYYSDAGRIFKMIFDPINNDIVNSDDKNIPFKNLDRLFCEITIKERVIISTHPHRWTKSSIIYILKSFIFKVLKMIAKIMFKIPFMKKIMDKYYYLAKKI